MPSCSVCPSVMFVDSVEINKHIFRKFSKSGSHTILVFLYQMSWQYSDLNPPPPTGGIECRLGRQKSRFLANIWLHRVLSTLWLARCYQHSATGPCQVVTLIAGSKWQSLLVAGDNDEMFITRSLNVAPKTSEQHLIARSDKSVACVTNNKILSLSWIEFWPVELWEVSKAFCLVTWYGMV